MLLGSEDIREAVRTGLIEISPFADSQVQPNSYDVTLSAYLLAFHPDHVFDLRKADRAADVDTIVIPDEGFVLQPGVFYLGATVEKIRCPILPARPKYAPMLAGKSTTARKGMKIEAAGFGDVGFAGTFTLEIEVALPVRVYAFSPIAQVSFTPVTGATDGYEGQYQHQVWPRLGGVSK